MSNAAKETNLLETAIGFVLDSNARRHGQASHHDSWEVQFSELLAAGRIIKFDCDTVGYVGDDIREACFAWTGTDGGTVAGLHGYWTRDALIAELTRMAELELYHAAKWDLSDTVRGYSQRRGERLLAASKSV